MRDADLAAEPGAEWNYHNLNHVVAACLVEVISGRPFAGYMATQVMGPLGMTHTESVNSTDDMPDQARGHVRAYGMLFSASHPRWFAARGHGVVTTAEELGQWLIAKNNHGLSALGRRVVSAHSMDVMHTPSEGREYAMGWFPEPAQ
jgi:CubicO group peptidase (beta-lactamase class C family)